MYSWFTFFIAVDSSHDFTINAWRSKRIRALAIHRMYLQCSAMQYTDY
jgi:hypothetical protein